MRRQDYQVELDQVIQNGNTKLTAAIDVEVQKHIDETAIATPTSVMGAGKQLLNLVKSGSKGKPRDYAETIYGVGSQFINGAIFSRQVTFLFVLHMLAHMHTHIVHEKHTQKGGRPRAQQLSILYE